MELEDRRSYDDQGERTFVSVIFSIDRVQSQGLLIQSNGVL